MRSECRIRRSIGIATALASTTLVLGVAAAVSVAGPGGPALVQAAGAVATVPPEPPPPLAPDTTTTAAAQAPSVEAAPRASAVAPSARPAPAPPPTTVPCRNSTDPVCGPFRWDPDPGPNQPLTVTITYSPQHPRAGEPVTFFVRAQDPDAAWFWGVSMDFGEPGRAAALDGASYTRDAPGPDYCAGPKYGPWTPPPRVPGDETLGNPPEKGMAHTYEEAGTYPVRFGFRSDTTSCGIHEPYGSYGAASAEVTVAPAGTTSTTASH